ncbi:MAG TPA: transcription factor FapR [Firmicutes bacterium]|jgi:acyl-coenzyme A thioesterase PaaI-like protein|nr:transcription factor FapR [Bacillota bacterium]
MSGKRLNKQARHQTLLRKLEENPLLTDEQLAKELGVSIQTIRLDRLALGLPEMKERAKSIASRALGGENHPASLEVVGELLYCEPGVGGLSRMVAEPAMSLTRYNVIRGHYLFAQANSLAVAVADAPHALTGSARVDFSRPVQAGHVLLARARVLEKRGRRFIVEVVTRVDEHEVFKGKFLILALDEKYLTEESLSLEGNDTDRREKND